MRKHRGPQSCGHLYGPIQNRLGQIQPSDAEVTIRRGSWLWQIFESLTRAGIAMMRPLTASCLLFLASLGLIDAKARVDFSNQANLPVDVFWRNEADQSYSLLASLEKGMRNGLNTFKGHKFLIAERGRPVGPKDFPNYIQQREEQVRDHLRKW